MVKRGQARQTLQNSGGGAGVAKIWQRGEGVAIIIYFLSNKNIHFLEFLR